MLLTQDHAPFPANLALINSSVCDMQELLEVDIAAQLTAMAEIAQADASIMDWLRNGQFENWRQTLPSRELGNLLESFLDTYGHRCAGESDVCNARWLTDPTPVFQGIMACAKEQPKELICMPAAQNIQKLEDAAGAKQRKAVQSLLTTIHLAAKLQSRALNAVAYILAGTRNWALAAAREAMVDDRLHEIDEVFFFELEEMKEMMTGEWNLSSMDEIRETLERRRSEHPGTSSAYAAEILIGDRPIESIAGGLPGTSGHVNGPLRRWQLPQPHICNGAVVGVGRLDSGWSLVLPIVRGIVTAQGTPLDPIVAAARIWHTPTILAIGSSYDGLVEGAQTTLDVEKLLVDQ
jgi:pyruvate,water dikinase